MWVKHSRKRRGENRSSSLLRGNRRLPLPSRYGRGARAAGGVGPSPFHRSRVPEPGMTTASKIPFAGRTATSPPAPLRKRRGENRSSSLLRGNRRLPLPSRNGRGGPAKRGRGRAVAFSSFQSAEPGMTTASKIVVRLSPPGTGGVAPRSGDGVGPSPFHRLRAPEPGMKAVFRCLSSSLTCRIPLPSPPSPHSCARSRR
jgi:hypothetical protein